MKRGSANTSTYNEWVNGKKDYKEEIIIVPRTKFTTTQLCKK